MKSRILKMEVDVTDLVSTLRWIELKIKDANGSYICVSNVHMCMEVFDSEAFSKVVNNADMVIPDGRPLYWAQKILGYKMAHQVRGQDIMDAICRESVNKNIKIGFYGGSSDVLLDQVKSKLLKKYSGLNVSYSFSPPFRPLTREEDRTVCDDINSSGIDVLFVGIGCPKQERWMAEHKEDLNCVMLGVGAAFDFIAGSKRHAPRWMQKVGLEWLFRLCSEPKRLWSRYLKQNPRFIYYFILQWIFKMRY